jgi:hypothetical protein
MLRRQFFAARRMPAAPASRFFMKTPESAGIRRWSSNRFGTISNRHRAVARCSELAADNRLVGSSSPPSPTTQSPSNRDFPVLYENPRIGGGFVRAFCLCGLSIGFQVSFWGLCLCPAKSRFPTAEAGVGGDLVRMLSQCDGRPIEKRSSCMRITSNPWRAAGPP